jgi:predicted permease
MLNRVRLWIRSVVLRRRLERDMQHEMAEHLAQSTERLVARGLTPEEARRQALREFGNVPYLQEQARDARGTAWLDALLGDSRFALRQFARKPVMTITMFSVLAVGMSISTLLFSYVHSYAVQPPAGIPLQPNLVRIRGSQTAGIDGRSFRTFSEEEFLAYRAMTESFSAVAGWTDAVVALTASDDAARDRLEARATFVTANYFSVLGVNPIVGAGLPTGELDGASAAVAVIGYSAWERLFAKRPDVIGATLEVNGVSVTVVGVAPERFTGVTAYSRPQLWLPRSTRPLVLGEASPGEFRAAGRLRPGVTPQSATAAVEVVSARILTPMVELRELEPSADVAPMLSANGDPMFERDVRLMTFSVGLLGLIVLMITCTNVSGLLTGLAVRRRQEIAIRLSLGAARMRIIRQLLTESVLLAAAAGVAALGIAWLTLRTVTRMIPAMPFEVGITGPATAFTFGIALAVGVLFGLSPALHATRLGIATTLRGSAGTIAAVRGRLQRGLVVTQIAFTQPLIVLLAAVLLSLTATNMPRSRTETSDRVASVIVRSAVPSGAASADATESRQQHRATLRRVLDRLQATPGIAGAVIDWRFQAGLGSYVAETTRASEDAQAAVEVSAELVAAGYFEVMGIPVVRGREFETHEAVSFQALGPEVPVIIGADLARHVWASADPIGRRLRAAIDSVRAARTLVVVGVVDDPLAAARRPGDTFAIYLPPDCAVPVGLRRLGD